MRNIEDSILDISHNYYKYLISLQNVNGVGLGLKKINGIWGNEPCIHVLVDEKLKENYLTKNNIIPKTYMGIKTDVIETGKVSLSNDVNNKGVNYDLKLRPLEGGCAISCKYFIGKSERFTTGTLGCIVTRKKNIFKKNYFILGNNHILAAFNQADIGSTILQPQKSSNQGQMVANLWDFVPLKFSGFFTNQQENNVDAAIAKISDKSLVSNKILGIGTIKGVNKPTLGLEIKKSGAKTGVTKGKIRTVGATRETTVSYGRLIFVNSIYSDMINDPGDSGACVFNENNEIVGMINGNDGKGGTMLQDINTILDALNLKIYKPE